LFSRKQRNRKSPHTPTILAPFLLKTNTKQNLFRPDTVRKDVTMTEDEKKLLQAKHRQEAVEARNRQKERKQRTRRLIQQGAILESVFPQAQIMELDDLKVELERRFKAEVTECH